MFLIQNVEDEDMSGERGTYFRDGRRKIGMSLGFFIVMFSQLDIYLQATRSHYSFERINRIVLYHFYCTKIADTFI